MRQPVVALLAATVALALGAAPSPGATGYLQTNLVSDLPAVASHQDANLVNPWGIASSASSPLWVSDDNAGVSSLYDGTGASQPLVVTIPASSGKPTAVLFNGTSDFAVGPGAPALFIFATEDGSLAGWNPAASATTAIIEVLGPPGKDYKGLALGVSSANNFLYAANFAGNTIDVFDATWAPTALTGTFTDPGLPAGFAPYGIENLGGELFVTYAKVDGSGHEPVPGAGSGFVDRFDTSGNFIARFASGGVLDAPWGLAVAPASFGDLASALLVGNFGDGRINAFDRVTGSPLGTLNDASAAPIAIPGLHGLRFGNGGNGGQPSELFFTAGIPGTGAVEDHGLLGKLTVAPLPAVVTVPTLRPPVLALLALLLAGAALLLLPRRR